MDLRECSESRFAAYVEELASVIGHKDRAGPLRDYCTGLMLPCERKSVEPMAAVTAPHRTAAQHQSLLHFVGEGRWSDAPVLAKVREIVLPQMEQHGPIEAWIIDDTVSQSRGVTRSALPDNIAASSARKTIAKSRSHCRWPIAMPAYRWPIVCICRKNGWTIANVCARRAFPRTSSSRPSMRSRSISCAGPARPDCRAAWC